jgi:hypothetical protein
MPEMYVKVPTSFFYISGKFAHTRVASTIMPHVKSAQVHKLNYNTKYI